MPEDLTPDEFRTIGLELAKKGGKQGRSIFYQFCFQMQDEFPEFVVEMMETILPDMPEQDQKIVLYVLDEINAGRTVDITKLVTDEIEGAIHQHLTK